jgi:hypothetical protein
VLKNCLANNPAAPWVAPIVKTWPDEYVDPAAVNAVGKVPSGYTGTYRLDPRDAIVVYGEMPPPGHYMSLQTWEFSQNGRWSADTYAKWKKTAESARPHAVPVRHDPARQPWVGAVPERLRAGRHRQ